MNNNQCYRFANELALDATQICAGDGTDEGKDTCGVNYSSKSLEIL